MNLLFENRIAEWKFSKTQVDAFRSESFKVEKADSDSDSASGSRTRSEATLTHEGVENVSKEV